MAGEHGSVEWVDAQAQMIEVGAVVSTSGSPASGLWVPPGALLRGLYLFALSSSAATTIVAMSRDKTQPQP